MGPFFSLISLIAIPFLAYGSAIVLNQAIAWGYRRTKKELEFPQRLTKRQHRRRFYIIAVSLLIPYGLAFAAAKTWPAVFILLLYMAILTAITIMDFEQQVIPDEFILVLICTAVLWMICVAQFPLNHLIAGTCAFILFLGISLITHGGIGGGDIKLIGALGLFLGINRIIFTVVLGILAGGIVSVILLATHRKGRKDAIAYGPYFAIAAMLALFWA